MYILAAGPGNYNESSPLPTIKDLADNPPRRDVQNVQPFGHIVVQMEVVNPGIWPFHCHIAWHASAGFFAQMVFLPEKIAKYSVPDKMAQTCKLWSDFTSRVAPDQIDSGL